MGAMNAWTVVLASCLSSQDKTGDGGDKRRSNSAQTHLLFLGPLLHELRPQMLHSHREFCFHHCKTKQSKGKEGSRE